MSVHVVSLPDGSRGRFEADSPQQAMANAQAWWAQNSPRALATADAARTLARRGPAGVLADSAGTAFTGGLARQVGAGTDAALTGIGNLVTRAMGGKPKFGMADTYAGYLQAAKDAEAAHPIQGTLGSLLGALGTAGLGAGAVKAAAGAAPAGNAVARLAQLAKGAGAAGGIGAVQGGVQAGLTAPVGQQLQDAQRGAVAGGVVGAALPVGATAAGAVVRPMARTLVRAANKASGGNLLDPTVEAGRRLSEALRQEGLTQDHARQVMNQWLQSGNQAPALLDVARRNGPVQRLLRSAANRPEGTASSLASDYADKTTAALPGRAQAVVRTNLAPEVQGNANAEAAAVAAAQQRLAANSPNRIATDVRDTTGIDAISARPAAEATVQQGRQDVGPLFDAVRAQQGPVVTPELAQLMQRPAVKASIAAAAKRLTNEGKDPAAYGLRIDPDTGAPVQTPQNYHDLTEVAAPYPTAEGWHLTKQAAQALVQRDGFTNAPILHGEVGIQNGGYQAAARDLTSELRNTIPGYGDALDQAGDYMSREGAYRRAADTLLSPGTDTRDVQAMFQSGSPAEQDAMRHSMANDIYQQAQNGRLTPNRLSSPAVRGKFQAAFGDDAGGNFFDRLAQERALADGSVIPAAQGERADFSAVNTRADAQARGARVMSDEPQDYTYGNAALLDDRDTQLAARTSILGDIGRPAEGATGLLNRLANAPNITENLTSTFGRDATDAMQSGINNEITRMRNARFIDSSTGSQTAGRQVDESLVTSLPTSKTHLLMAAVNAIKNGATITDGEREAIVRYGTSPATDELLAKLAQDPRHWLSNAFTYTAPALAAQSSQIGSQ